MYEQFSKYLMEYSKERVPAIFAGDWMYFSPLLTGNLQFLSLVFWTAIFASEDQGFMPVVFSCKSFLNTS